MYDGRHMGLKLLKPERLIDNITEFQQNMRESELIYTLNLASIAYPTSVDGTHTQILIIRKSTRMCF